MVHLADKTIQSAIVISIRTHCHMITYTYLRRGSNSVVNYGTSILCGKTIGQRSTLCFDEKSARFVLFHAGKGSS